MRPYRQTIPGIMFILDLFFRNHFLYLLFKCDHIFEGQNKNVDILFKTDEDYYKAAALLETIGFVIRLSEKVEKYKTMYCGLLEGNLQEGIMYSIHLHREIAWHGMVALDKQPVFQRARQVHPLIIIPGIEDSILIHAAHVLFENFKVKERERGYFLRLNESYVDKDYIRWQIRKNCWEEGFWRIVKEEHISKAEIAQAWIKKIWKDPATAAYLSLKALRIPLQKMSLKRRGCLIALIGVNGSGKSTLAKKVLEACLPITSHLGTGQHYYYYGWKPTFIVTGWLSALLKSRGKEIFKEVNIKAKPPGFDPFQEIQFLYIYLEFLYRYYAEIRPLLRKGDLIITDRYFYDIYGQYPYAKQSRIARPLLALFPRPDKTYFLDADVGLLASRSKTDKFRIDIQPTKRIVLPFDYLRQQRINYQELSSKLSFNIIDTSQPLQKNVDEIIKDSWREYL